MTELLDFLHIVEITNQLKDVTADPDDDMIIECALVGNATHIITGDRRHLLPLESYEGILIVKPTDFLCKVPIKFITLFVKENMQTSHKYLDPVALSRIGGMELVARLVVEGFVTGLHQKSVSRV